MPLVSVLMVTHRDTPYLRPAIASVLAQTLADIELVLVDNGSGLSAASLGELGRDARVRWVRLPRHLGIPGGHNAGVAAARGEFVALLDHDDVMLPTRLARQVALLQAEPALGLVSSQAETIDGDGKVVGREFSLTVSASQLAYTQFAAPVVTPAYTGRRALFARFPYRAELPLAADFDFLARAAEAAPFGHAPETLLRYRRHRAQATQEYAAAIERDRCLIRLLTARRRGGRPENFPTLTSPVPAARPSAPPPPPAIPRPAASCIATGRQSLTEKFFVLAAYHGRRAFVLGRTPVEAWQGGRLGLRAIAAASGDQRRQARRMFFTGPVRTLGLK